MSTARRTAVVAVLPALVLAALATGCGLVAQPDSTAWDDHAEQAVSDATSEVATARLALETARRERAWSSYTVVLVAQAEESLGTVQDDLSRLQVPPGRDDEAARLDALLDEAATAVEDARSSAVEGRYDDRRVLDALDRVTGRLEDAAGG
ncbi:MULTISPECIES: hypothetical protein [unclassified Nocardioides]|jgi:hypothetical protein|uniref:hypothetical protein n=1 Tax=unclassified Nocardioides TaxID=2615069 RepID=UPI0007031AFC|nr:MULTISPECIES: hypothetical protein [unclassified Nocardioides]KRC59679.1 hypothetical protein ASE19_01240 [Nocardioides sp. Root79]KRC68496.1 hypothetical protein ASE20_16720 [Nocardioides sp. Root240]